MWVSKEDIQEQIELKRKFARASLKNPDNPFKAALCLFPDDMQRSLDIAYHWPLDSEVKALIVELSENAEPLEFQPTIDEIAWDILQRARNCRDDKAFFLGMKVYTDYVNKIKERELLKNSSSKQPILIELSSIDMSI